MLEFSVCEPLVPLRDRCWACGKPGGHCPTCCTECRTARLRRNVDLDPVTLHPRRLVRRRLRGKQAPPEREETEASETAPSSVWKED